MRVMLVIAIYILLIICFLEKMLSVTIKEVMKAWARENITQEETNSILSNFEESIICKSKSKIGYSNGKGKKIIRYLRRLANSRKDAEILDLKVLEIFNH